MTDRVYMDLQEFIDLGFLQEINRVLLHPAGLALAMVKPGGDDLTKTTMRVWDYRDDPEGMFFAHNEISGTKIDNVVAATGKHVDKRMEVMSQTGPFAHIQRPDSILAPPED